MNSYQVNSDSQLSSLTANIYSSAMNLKKLSENTEILRTVVSSVNIIVEAYKNGGCLYVAGNGGSAADAQHLVAELVSKLDKNRTPIRGYALTTDTSILTAIGNDYGFEYVFSRQLEAQMSKNDIFFAITTSGQSLNILKAIESARKIGAKTILLCGRDGGPAKALADHSIIATGDNTAQIQEAHITIYHNICWLLEGSLVQEGLCRYL